MARRCVHETRAGVGGNVFACEQRHIEFIALAAERMGGLQTIGLEIAHALQRDFGMFGGLIGQHVGKRDALACLAECALACFGDFVDAILQRGRIGDGAVTGDCPRCRRPDHDADIAARHGELHIDRGRCFLVIFHFGFGERGFFHRRPHHRAEAAIEKPVADEFVQLACDHRLGAEIHRRVGCVPQAGAAKPLDLLTLDVEPVGGEGAAIAAQFVGRDFVFRSSLGAIFLLDLPFDRKTVAIPAGNIRRILAQHVLRADDEIFQDVVEAGAGMDVSIGVDRAIVQHKQFAAFRGFALLAVKIHRGPAGEPFGLGFGQARFHRKVGRGQEQGGAVIARLVVLRGLVGGRLIGHGLSGLERSRWA